MKRLVVAALAALAILPPAAQARTDDFAKPVLFVPGPEDSSCDRFLDAEQHLQEYTTTVQGTKIGFSGEAGEVGLFTVSPGCIQTAGASRDDSLAQLGAKLASWIKAKYGTQAIDVVAFGGGGLVVRSALAQQPSLKLEDVVAVGAPNGGSDALAAKCGARPVCAELAEGSATIKALAAGPQGAGGTDWSAIGSESDSLVSAASAVAMDAEHKTIYRSPGPSHDALLSDVSDKQDGRIRYSHGASRWIEWNQAPHPVERIAEDLVFGAGSTPGACGLQATQPELCGKTPVILVPGFGASQIVCGADEENMWPAAMFAPNYWNLMSLAFDGRTAAHSDNCSRTARPNGHVLRSIDVAGIGVQNIHGNSWAWLQRIAPGRAYEFGWDFRKGPEETLDRLDQFIDEVRARHGVERVALVAHSYGGLLSRWYVDEPARARKVARVANFGSPFWGAPKAWFAMAYGYEQPGPSPIDVTVDNYTFKGFSKNLAGLYYLFPPKAWFDRAPAPLRSWLEVDEKPVQNVDQAVDAIRAFHGNGDLAARIARNHADHIDGFKRTNGVDWRIFVGSGKLTMGHVRAYSGSDEVQYSWINGDGTVPLLSQRQYGSNGTQMGDKTPTYNFCDIGHMGEMEDPGVEQAATPFVADGSDPIVDGKALRSIPCSLDGTEFKVTGDEDARSIEISKAANASAARAHASQAPASLSLAAAEADGLVDVIREPKRTVIVTDAAVTLRVGGAGRTQVTPVTGDGKRGASVVYDGPVVISADGSKTSSASPSRPADTRPPRTTAKRRGGKLTLRARDASGVAVTMVKVGRAKAKPYKRAVKVRRGVTVRYWSIDTFGNVEKVNRAG